MNQFIPVIIMTVLLYSGLVFYIGWSGYRWLRPTTSSRRFKIIYTFMIVLAATSFILGRISRVKLLSIVGAYWMACFYLLLMIVPLAHLTVILLRFTKLPRESTRKWAGSITLVLVVSFLGYGMYNAYSPVVHTYEIKMDKRDSSLNTLHIAIAADTHFGLLSDKNHAQRLVREMNKLGPDLILLPGDLLDDDVQPFIDQKIHEILSNLQAPYGVYVSLGNHDRHNGTMEELIEALEHGGIHVLYDEITEVQGQLTLIGRKDRMDSERLSLERLMEDVDRTKPTILLEHQPYDLHIAQQAGIDLMVSGHTHGGQVFPGRLITSRLYENHRGYLQKEKMHSIVTSGFGFWGPPIRIGTRSEIVSVKIQFQ